MKKMVTTLKPSKEYWRNQRWELTWNELESLAKELRYKVIELSFLKKTAHIGSSLSSMDILIALYANILKISPEEWKHPFRDRFILSKGHAAIALYTVLSAFGFFPESWLEQFGETNAPLEEHLGPKCAPGIEVATGSLGHGLSIGAGICLAGEIRNTPINTCVLLSDGELNEGAVWEAAMFAAGKKLKTLTAIVDFNGWQATGRSSEVLSIEPIIDKWKSFGWQVFEVNGHHMEALCNILSKSFSENKGPTVVIARTIKGKGISFMEDDNNWHYRIPSEKELHMAKRELSIL